MPTSIRPAAGADLQSAMARAACGSSPDLGARVPGAAMIPIDDAPH